MRNTRVTLTMLALAVTIVAPAAAQTPEADCQAGRERLAGHARASDAARRLVAARAGTAAGRRTAATPGGRAAEIRTRLTEIPRERRRVDDARVAAIVKLDFARAAQAQGQLETLEQERRRLERELATLPQSPAAQAPMPSPTPAAGAPDVDRVVCRDVAATLDAALKARRRELGAREAQAGAIPLAPLRGPTTTAVARRRVGELARRGGAGARGREPDGRRPRLAPRGRGRRPRRPGAVGGDDAASQAGLLLAHRRRADDRARNPGRRRRRRAAHGDGTGDVQRGTLAHEELAGHLSTHRLDLLPRDALGQEPGDEHLIPVGLRGIARLAEVGAEHEALGADLLDVRGRLFVGHLAPVTHERQVRIPPHERSHGVDFHLRAHGGGVV